MPPFRMFVPAADERGPFKPALRRGVVVLVLVRLGLTLLRRTMQMQAFVGSASMDLVVSGLYVP